MFQNKKKKDPIPVEVFPKLAEAYGGLLSDIDNLRLLVLALVGYAGFLPISELLLVKVEDINFFLSHVSISIPERKNDQYREGHVVNIGRTGKLTCPVAMTELFISKAQCYLFFVICVLLGSLFLRTKLLCLRQLVMKLYQWMLSEAGGAVFIKNSKIYSKKLSRVLTVKALL